MNSKQRRTQLRKGINGVKPTLIKDWKELASVEPSSTHRLEIDTENGCGWVIDLKNNQYDKKRPRYLTTHTFYGSSHRSTTLFLRSRGFNITLANWDCKEMQEYFRKKSDKPCSYVAKSNKPCGSCPRLVTAMHRCNLLKETLKEAEEKHKY